MFTSTRARVAAAIGAAAIGVAVFVVVSRDSPPPPALPELTRSPAAAASRGEEPRIPAVEPMEGATDEPTEQATPPTPSAVPTSAAPSPDVPTPTVGRPPMRAPTGTGGPSIGMSPARAALAAESRRPAPSPDQEEGTGQEDGTAPEFDTPLTREEAFAVQVEELWTHAAASMQECVGGLAANAEDMVTVSMVVRADGSNPIGVAHVGAVDAQLLDESATDCVRRAASSRHFPPPWMGQTTQGAAYSVVADTAFEYSVVFEFDIGPAAAE